MHQNAIASNPLLYGNILLLLLGGVQGLLLCFLLFRKKAYREGYGFLMLYLGVMIAQIIFKVVDKWWLLQHVNTAYQISYLFPLLYGPLALLFAQRFAAPSGKFQPVQVLHFVPFLLGLVVLHFLPFEPLAGTVFRATRGWGGLAGQLILLGVYHYYALRQCHAIPNKGLETDVKFDVRRQWLKQFLVHSWWICSVVSGLLILMYQTHPYLMPLRFGFVLLTGFIYWVSYCALRQPALFFPGSLPLNGVALTHQNGHAVLPQNGKKYANSPLKESEAARIEAALQELALQRTFTDASLTIEKLSEQVQTNRHALSQVLNERLGQSFFDYINGLRVEEAKRLLADPACQHLKIAAIAYDAGFNSLSVFNDVFKKQTGQTPSHFRKMLPIKAS